MPKATKKFVKIGEASKNLGVSIDTLRRWEKSGKIEVIRTPGGTRLYSNVTLNELTKDPVKKYQRVKVPKPQLTTVEELIQHLDGAPQAQQDSQNEDIFVDEREAEPEELSVYAEAEIPSNLSTSEESKPTSEVFRRSHRIYAITAFSGVFACLIITSLLLARMNNFQGIFTKTNNTAVKTEDFKSKADVLSVETTGYYLNIKSDVVMEENLAVGGSINGLVLTPNTDGYTISGGTSASRKLTVVNGDVTLDQDVSTKASPSFVGLKLTATSNQLSMGGTGTLTWTPSGTHIITFPSATGTVLLDSATQTITNKTISGSSNTFSSIPNSALSNYKITITAGTNLSGGGDIDLGSSGTLSLKSDVALTSLTATGNVQGATLTGTSYLTLSQTTAPSTITDKLYNVAGTLIWNGLDLTSGGSLPVGTAGQTIYNNAGIWTATSNLTNNGTTVSFGSGLTVTNGSIASDLNPATTDLYNLGSASLEWNRLYLKDIAAIGGKATFTGIPTGSSVSDGSIYINPASTPDPGYTVFGVAVGGVEKLRMDATGNITIQGNVIGPVTGSMGYWSRNSTPNVYPTSITDSVVTMGNVGVGTTNPGQELEVQGEGYFTSGVYIGANNTNNLISAASTGASTTPLYIGNQKIATTGGGGTITGATNQVGYFTGTDTLGGSNNLWFDGTSVGIGTTTPVAGLEVASAGAASTPGDLISGTWFTGGSQTTTKPQLLIEPTSTTSTGWSTSGTGLGINSAQTFAGNLLDLQQAGISTFKVAGVSTAVNGFTFSTTATGSSPTFAATGSDTNLGLNINTKGTGTMTLTSAATTGTTTTSAFVANASAITTGTGLYLTSGTITTGKLADFSTTLNTFSSGTLLNVSTTSTGLTSGSLASFDWSPTGTTNIYSTGDLFSISTGNQYAFVGNLLNVKSQGSSVFSVSDTAVTASIPTSFTSPGDVGMAYDLNFTNTTASYIRSKAPFSIEAGEVFNSSDLTLKTYNQGSIVLTQDSLVASAATSYGVQMLSNLNDNAVSPTTHYSLYNLPTVNITGDTLTNMYTSYAGMTNNAGTVTNWYGYYADAPTGSGTTTNAYGFSTAALATATSYGVNIGALSGATANYGVNVGAISGTGTAAGLTTGAMSNTGATAYQLNLGAISGANATDHAALNSGAISGTTANAYGINLSTLTGGTTGNYQINTGTLTGVASATNAQLNLGTSVGAASATTYGINVGAISGAGTATYGINLGANSSTATTNYGMNIGAISGAGTNNYGLNIGAVSGAATGNYALVTNGGQVSITDTSNTAASLVLTNNTATTIGNGANTLGVIDLQSTSLTTGNFLNMELNALSAGKGLNLTSTSTTLSSGSLASFDWSPTGSTNIYATGDLVSISTGNQYAFVGNLLNVKSQGSSVFSVSDTAVTTSVPATFTSPGDVALSYDLNFMNDVSSNITSASNLSIAAGESFNSSNLTLTTYNQGSVIIDQQNNPTATATSYALQVLPNLTSSTAAMTYTAMYGIYNVSTVNLSGDAAVDLTTAYGSYTGLTNNAGVISNWYGYYADAPTGAGTITTAYGLGVGALSTATSYGLSTGAMSGATANYGINIGAISGTGTAASLTTGALSNTGATAYQLNLGAISGANATAHAALNSGAISGATTNAYGINLSTLTGGTTGNYQINTGTLTNIASATSAQLNLGTSVGAASATTYGINVGAISGAGTATYGINVGTNASTATTNYGMKIGAVSGAGTTNYGLYVDTVSGAGTNYSAIFAGGNVGIGTTSPSQLLHLQNSTVASIKQTWTNTGGIGESVYYENSTYMGGIGVFGSAYTTTPLWQNAFVMTAANDNLGKLIFRTKTGSTYYERMLIDNNGNVGIGTTLPVAGLENAKAGAASTPGDLISGTWFTGGSATTTKPQLLIEPTGTTSTGWSTNGTGLGINSAQTFAGNLLDLQQAGISTFKVAGVSTAVNGFTFTTAATGAPSTVSMAATGSDANITLGIDSKGTGALNLGTGASAKTITIGNNTTSTALALTSGTGSQTFTSSVATTTTTSSAFVFNDASLTTGTGAYFQAAALTQGKIMDINTAASNATQTTGTLLNLTSTSTVLSTGSLITMDWTPGSAPTTPPTGDLFSLNVGPNGSAFAGNLFNLKDNGSSLFSVSNTVVTSSIPVSITAPGDTTFAYDLNMTNPTAAYIKSAAPLYLQAGETFNSSDLTLSTFNLGSVILNQNNQTTTASGTAYSLQVIPTLTSATNSLALTWYSMYNVPTVNETGTGVGVTSLYNNYQGLTATAGTITNWFGNYVAAPTGAGTVTNKYAFVSESGSGNVGIGTTAPPSNLSVIGNMGIGTTYGNVAAPADGLIVESKVGIGTTAPGLALDVVGSARFSAVGAGTYNADLNITSDGTLTTAASDINMKTNLDPLKDSLNKIMSLKTYSFNWISNGKKDLGLIAQEVAPIIPEITFTNPVDNKMGINYSRFAPLLISAVQELNNKIALMENSYKLDSNGKLVIPEAKIDKLIISGDVDLGSNATFQVDNTTASLSTVIASASAAILQMDSRLRGNDIMIAKTESQVDVLSAQVSSMSAEIASLSASLRDHEVARQSSDSGVMLEGAQRPIASNSADSILYRPSDSRVQNDASTSASLQNDVVPATPSASLQNDVTLNLTPPEILLSTTSAQLVDLSVTSEATFSGKLTAYDLSVQNNFKSLGQSFLGSTTIAGDLTVDGTLSINGSSLNSIACRHAGGSTATDSISDSIASLQNDGCGILYLQNSPLAGAVDFFNGLVTIDKTGKLTATEIIAKTVITEKLVIKNTPGVSPGSPGVDASIGEAIIPAGQVEIPVFTTAITDKSKVFLTATTPTGGQAITQGEIVPESGFVVRLDHAFTGDIKFNWFIVDQSD